MIRIGPKLRAALSVWKSQPDTRLKGPDGKPLSIARQCAALMRHTVRRFIQGELGANEIKQRGVLGCEKSEQSVYRIDVPYELVALTEELFKDTDVQLSMPELFRAAIRFFPAVNQRQELESEYVRKGGTGYVESMSDDFLFLWNKFNGEGPVEDGVRIVRALKDLEMKYQSMLKKVDSLDALFYRYGIKGILDSSVAPMKRELEAMNLQALNAVAKRWGITVPKKTNEYIVRRILLAHFGHSTELIRYLGVKK